MENISLLLFNKNLDSPLEETVAVQYRTNKSAFNKTVKEWTKKYVR